MFKRLAHAIGVGLFAGTLALPLHDAAAVGVAVNGFGSDAIVGSTQLRPLLGGDAIRYFIPLSDDTVDCVYGVSCGTIFDRGSGGQTMEMYLKFEPVSTTSPSQLIINFEDLDLIDANDPVGFLESVQVFDSAGLITNLIDEITDDFVSGDGAIQTLTIALGVLLSETYFIRLDFISDFGDRSGRNTPEYLIAEIHPVPLPAALPLFGTGLGIMGFIGWRRRRRFAREAGARSIPELIKERAVINGCLFA